MEAVKYKDLFPKDYYIQDKEIEVLKNKIADALAHLQRGTKLDVVMAIRILK